MDIFKSDKEYGYRVDLKDNRELLDGNAVFDFSGRYTEVEVLQEILDKYIDTSSIDSICLLPNHKVEFSVSFLDSMIIIVSKKMNDAISYLNSVEAQLLDINHRIIKPNLCGKVMSKEDKLKIYDMQEELLLQRRNLKDALSIQKIFIENLEKNKKF